MVLPHTSHHYGISPKPSPPSSLFTGLVCDGLIGTCIGSFISGNAKGSMRAVVRVVEDGTTSCCMAVNNYHYLGIVVAPVTASGLVFIDAGGDPVQLSIDGQV